MFSFIYRGKNVSSKLAHIFNSQSEPHKDKRQEQNFFSFRSNNWHQDNKIPLITTALTSSMQISVCTLKKHE